MKSISILVFLFSCQLSSQEAINNTRKSFVDEKEISKGSNVQNLIDTSLNFRSIEEFVKYKEKVDANFRRNILKNDSLSTFEKQRVEFKNSILTHYAVYKILKASDKSQLKNFQWLNFIINSNELFSQNELLEIYNSFPSIYRNSERGKKYLRVISSRNKSIGKSVDRISQIILQKSNGDTINLGSIIDKKFDFHVLMFTASWCSPCIYYSQVHKSKLEKIDSSKINLMSISIDTDEKKWRKFIHDEGYKWNCYLDLKGFQSQFLRYFEFNAIPKYFLLDNEGRVLDERSGDGMDSILQKVRAKISKTAFSNWQ